MSNAQGSWTICIRWVVARPGHDWVCIELMAVYIYVGGWWVMVLEEEAMREGEHEKLWLFRSMAEQGRA